MLNIKHKAKKSTEIVVPLPPNYEPPPPPLPPPPPNYPPPPIITPLFLDQCAVRSVPWQVGEPPHEDYVNDKFFRRRCK